MKTLYLDCSMGAAGDMLTGALLELVPDRDQFIEQMNGIGIPGVRVEKEAAVKCGIRGTGIRVLINGETEEDCHHHHHDHEGEHHHSHSHLHDIEELVNERLNLPEKVKKDIIQVFYLIAEAESRVHDQPLDHIHFHEVGSMDAVADITAVCLLMNMLSPDRVIASPIHVGSGSVKCAHGILPVPAPATARILQDAPIYSGTVRGELCTPTGAALIKYFADEYGSMPVMVTRSIGYGMGKKDFETANCVRVFLGETQDREDEVIELNSNVDDMRGEELGFAMERLFEAGALEVFYVAAVMKKSRPGIVMHVLCEKNSREKIVETIFRYTSTIGIRETTCRRHVLQRSIEQVQTPFGDIRCKKSSGYGVQKSKFEYEDLASAAVRNGLSIEEVLQKIQK